MIGKLVIDTRKYHKKISNFFISVGMWTKSLKYKKWLKY